jgi:hypothetical protein
LHVASLDMPAHWMLTVRQIFHHPFCLQNETNYHHLL